MKLLPMDKLGARASQEKGTNEMEPNTMKLLPVDRLGARTSQEKGTKVIDPNTMELLPLDKLGARASQENPYIINFGIFLPGISENDGNKQHQLWVKIIHEHDQFLQDIQPHTFKLDHTVDPKYGDYWSAEIHIKKQLEPTDNTSNWGKDGTYVYRYCLEILEENDNKETIDWIIDPFAREFGMGKFSAITVGYEEHEWSEHEKNEWKTPPLNELVIYELMINEFGGGIEGTIKQLDYLADLGVNCIEVMPISNVANTVDWGYMPIGYFGVDERFGNTRDMQRLIDEAHKRKIAVIFDVVYAHTSDSFAYSYIYKELGESRFPIETHPFMGRLHPEGFGLRYQRTNFNNKFTRDFFFTVNHYLLERYHVDGFRYDYVPGYWDKPTGNGYANLTYSTYDTVKKKEQTVKEKKEGWEDWQRFFNNGTINLIQCAEQLEASVEILSQSYSNCTWQNETLDAARKVAQGNQSELYNLGMKFGLDRYPTEVTTNGDKIAKTALQYIENHDNPRFVCHYRTALFNEKPNEAEKELSTEGKGNLWNEKIRPYLIWQEGKREDLWFKVQPYLIGILTAKGIPMLYQGQELGENYHLPPDGWGRANLLRFVRWEYFYDNKGKTMISLVRKLIKLRKNNPQFRSLNSDGYYFHNDDDRYQSKDVLVFYRKHDNHFSIIALNFSNDDRTIQFRFPDDKNFQLPKDYSGNYREELHGKLNLKGITKDGEHELKIPSNYGRIWTLEPST